jgi:hypothetical protein
MPREGAWQRAPGSGSSAEGNCAGVARTSVTPSRKDPCAAAKHSPIRSPRREQSALPLRPQDRHDELVAEDPAKKCTSAGDTLRAKADLLVRATGTCIVRERAEPEAMRVGLSANTRSMIRRTKPLPCPRQGAPTAIRFNCATRSGEVQPPQDREADATIVVPRDKMGAMALHQRGLMYFPGALWS